MPEPVAEWTNMTTGVDLLKNFYQENEKWTFPFENLVQLSRLKTFCEAKKYFKNKIDAAKSSSSPKKHVFIERSFLSSYNVFIQNSYEQKRLNKIEFDILTEYYILFTNEMNNFFSDLNQMSLEDTENKENSLTFKKHVPASDKAAQIATAQRPPFKVIYLRTDPEICFQRVKYRSRDAESDISLEYLQQIHDKYEKWIDRIEEKSLVKVVDGNHDINHIVKQIENFL